MRQYSSRGTLVEERRPFALVRRERYTVGQKLLIRLGTVIALIVLVILVFYLDRSGLHDNVDGEVSLTDVVYFTFITLTTVGYGDIAPVSDQARLLDAILITPIRLVIWLLFIGTAYQFLFQRLFERIAMAHFADKLDRHVIVCGYGYKGRSALRELRALGYRNDDIVVIDTQRERIEDAVDSGLTALVGDCTQDAVLKAARVDKARAMLVCLTRDDSTTLTVLSARHLNPELRILATVREEENIVSVERAGAQLVIAQQRLGGFLLAAGVESDVVVPALVELGSARGRMHVAEAEPTDEEMGQPPSSVKRGLVLGIWRDGHFVDFDEASELTLRTGDKLVLILANRNHPPGGPA